MRKLSSASCTFIAVVALASVTVGCHKKEPAAVDTTVTTTVPATPVAAGTSDMAGSSGSGMAGATGSGSGSPGARASDTNQGAASTGAAHGMDQAKPAVKNNTGQTQGTSATSLPTSDGSR